ncbi:hypothetical protein HGA64_05655, partial [Candidatus Falkowbacteria bacterium]|nr:hypothetical protein [Candidatus Falkowbacteria bacterium]
MPNILILNVGTTSIAYKLFDQQYVELSSGSLPSGDFNASFKQLLRQVINYGDIAIVGHRIVHGGNEYYRPFVVNQYNIQKFKELADFASLYNVPAIEGVEKAMEFLPEATHVSVFDTAFFYELPETAKTYPLPRQIQEAGLRRYGFHGLSHEHAMNEAASVLKIRPNGINLISIHLGDTDSVAAIKSGKPIEISNGCDPRDGLVTMSSSGSLDANFILQLLHIFQGEISQGKITKVFDILNNGSGIKALCGIDNFQEL